MDYSGHCKLVQKAAKMFKRLCFHFQDIADLSTVIDGNSELSIFINKSLWQSKPGFRTQVDTRNADL